ncbi:MAG: tetratricopeptide repeat protein [Treponema sp.]|nr:tetratricopeptide repeat protein [Treponema sp.]
MIERADTLNNQAILLAKDGHFNEALACLRRAIHIDRNNYLVWFNLGITYRDAGDLPKAVDALQNAFSISPDQEDVVEALCVACMNLHLLDRAFEFCEEGLDYHPTSARLWNLLGVLQFNDNEFDDAAESFEMAVTINPYYLDALYNLHDTYIEQKNVNGVKITAMKIKELEGNRK